MVGYPTKEVPSWPDAVSATAPTRTSCPAPAGSTAAGPSSPARTRAGPTGPPVPCTPTRTTGTPGAAAPARPPTPVPPHPAGVGSEPPTLLGGPLLRAHLRRSLDLAHLRPRAHRGRGDRGHPLRLALRRPRTRDGGR